jgi:hypothetical protein
MFSEFPALYQGPTLVGPLSPAKMRALSPCLSLPGNYFVRDRAVFWGKRKFFGCSRSCDRQSINTIFTPLLPDPALPRSISGKTVRPAQRVGHRYGRAVHVDGRLLLYVGVLHGRSGSALPLRPPLS